MDVDIGLLKALRKKTSAGMQDCMRALTEAKGDTALAEGLLKEWGLAGVAKRSERAMNEGRVFIRASERRAAMVELGCETDFVARGELFLDAGGSLAESAFSSDLAATDPKAESLVAGLASVLKENISLRRIARMEAGQAERVDAYLHGDGRVGVLLVAKADVEAAFADERVRGFFHDLALHVAAFGPRFLGSADVSEEYARERREAFMSEIAEDEKLRGKAPEFLEGILAGKMKKHLREVCLLERGFVRDEKRSVRAVMEAVGAECGFSLSIASFVYFKVDDGEAAEGGE